MRFESVVICLFLLTATDCEKRDTTERWGGGETTHETPDGETNHKTLVDCIVHAIPHFCEA
jgi:hypothetical protein